MPVIDAFVTVRPQIILFQQNFFDEICSTVTYVANAIYPVPILPSLSVSVNTLHISEAPILYQDQWLQEFLDGKECCPNFINQDLTFLQPSMAYEMTVSDDSLSTVSDSTDASVITVQENNPFQEVDTNSSPTSLTALSDDLISTDNSPTTIQPVEPAPIQPVEPVIGLTTKEKGSREEDPNITPDELLGLSSCEDFGQGQSQLFTVLEKYHLSLDNLENLQSQFGFLKQATSKNVKYLQQAINVQQTCTATICTYINNILPVLQN